MVTKTNEEMDALRQQIRDGELPADTIERYYEDEARNVFGYDAKKDKNGNYIEQGLGSPSQPSRNSIAAYMRYCNPDNPKASDPDPNFKENLKKMEADLAAYRARMLAAREQVVAKNG